MTKKPLSLGVPVLYVRLIDGRSWSMTQSDNTGSGDWWPEQAGNPTCDGLTSWGWGWKVGGYYLAKLIAGSYILQTTRNKFNQFQINRKRKTYPTSWFSAPHHRMPVNDTCSLLWNHWKRMVPTAPHPPTPPPPSPTPPPPPAPPAERDG